MIAKVDDYQIGDVVQNCASRDKLIGSVVGHREYQGRKCVVVEFPPHEKSRKQNPWHGAYDDDWLRIQNDVGGLRKIETK